MLLKNGLLVFEDGSRKGDLRISGERILEFGEKLPEIKGEEILDLEGLVVMPGGVDVHTHMDLDLGAVRSTDDFFTGTVAAACGGTTAIVDHMAFGPSGCSPRHQVDVYHRLAEGKAVIDYGFHGVLDRVDEEVLSELRALLDEGITSYKCYLTYARKVSDREVLRLMEFGSEFGGMLAVHAENDGVIARLKEKYLAEGKTAPIYHARSRPPESEAEAVSRMAFLARIAGDAPLYVVHLTSKLGLDTIRVMRERGQRRLFAETCPQYLLLDESRYLDPDGLKYVMSPPLRSPENLAGLWEGVLDGSIDTIGTDHCPFFFGKEKQLGRDDFSKAPGGAPGVETRIPLMFAEVASGRLTQERMLTLCSSAPARLFGMYPQKGVIAEGSDADLVIIDPERKGTVTRELLHENTDYTPYEGMPLAGLPTMTFSRGECIVREGRFVGRKGRGKFLKRGLPDLSPRP